MTGTSEGMGRCAVREFAAKGANVIVVARQTEKLKQVVEEMKVCHQPLGCRTSIQHHY
jgi:short-subunit dehydrogenase